MIAHITLKLDTPETKAKLAQQQVELDNAKAVNWHLGREAALHYQFLVDMGLFEQWVEYRERIPPGQLQ